MTIQAKGSTAGGQRRRVSSSLAGFIGAAIAYLVGGVVVAILTRNIAAANAGALLSGFLGYFVVGVPVAWYQHKTAPERDFEIMRLIAAGAMSWSGADSPVGFWLHDEDPVHGRRYRDKARLVNLVTRGWVEPFQRGGDSQYSIPVGLTPAGYGVLRFAPTDGWKSPQPHSLPDVVAGLPDPEED
jgi:hypothetical protein